MVLEFREQLHLGSDGHRLSIGGNSFERIRSQFFCRRLAMQDFLFLHSRYRIPDQSLALSELGELESFLGSGAAPTVLRSIDTLHGFLSCAALSSTDMEQERWLPLVWSIAPEVPPRFASAAQEERLAGCVLRMFDDVVLALADPDMGFSPLVSRAHDDCGGTYDDGRSWSSGFLLGMVRLAEDLWPALLAKPATAGLLLPMFLLGYPSLPPAWDSMVGTLPQRHRLTGWIPAAMEAIHVQRFALELSTLKKTRAVLAAARFNAGRC